MAEVPLTPEAQARIARDEAARIASLWQKIILTDKEVAAVLGLPYSTHVKSRKRGDAPKTFRLGRRLYSRTCDVISFLDEKSREEGKP